MDLFDEFLNPLLEQPDPPLEDRSNAQVKQARSEFSTLMKRVPRSTLAAPLRDQLQWQRTADQQDLLFQAAAGMRQCVAEGISLRFDREARSAAAIDLKPEDLETAAQQDMSLG